MSITPVEVATPSFPGLWLGDSRRATDNLLESVAQSYEQTWWERADLRDEVERLQAELARFKDMERLLRDTMMSAEKAAEDLRSQLRREYDMLLQEARLKAREIVLEAEAERERIRAEIRRLQTDRSEVQASYRSFLQSALERLDRELEKPETFAERTVAEAEAEPEPEPSPAEESTEMSPAAPRRGGAGNGSGRDPARRDGEADQGRLRRVGDTRRQPGPPARVRLRVSPGATGTRIVGRHGDGLEGATYGAARAGPCERRSARASRDNAPCRARAHPPRRRGDLAG